MYARVLPFEEEPKFHRDRKLKLIRAVIKPDDPVVVRFQTSGDLLGGFGLEYGGFFSDEGDRLGEHSLWGVNVTDLTWMHKIPLRFGDDGTLYSMPLPAQPERRIFATRGSKPPIHDWEDIPSLSAVPSRAIGYVLDASHVPEDETICWPSLDGVKTQP